MEPVLIIITAIVVPLILFPAAVIWYLNFGAIKMAITRSGEAEEVKNK